MLTPVEIQSKSFRSGGLGYDKKDVDQFMREVLKSYEYLYRENMELNDKISVLNDGIQQYRSIEKTLQKALVLAEKTAEETRSAAIAEAKRIEAEALANANLIIADAKNDLDRLHLQTVNLIQQYESYKIQFKNMAAAQVELLSSDAFSINLARLDAFVATNPLSGEQKPEEHKPQKSKPEKSKPYPVPALDDADDIPAAAAAAMPQKIDGTDYDTLDLDYYDIEGQEEFDFIDLEDSE